MHPEHVTKRCPHCGGASRTLAVVGDAHLRHQCLACGRRHESRLYPREVAAARVDKFACLLNLPREDRELVEALILLMLGTGALVGAVELKSADVGRLRSDLGPPTAVLRVCEFPVFSWLVDQAGSYASHFVAIDQGATRVCFKVRRRRSAGR